MTIAINKTMLYIIIWVISFLLLVVVEKRILHTEISWKVAFVTVVVPIIISVLANNIGIFKNVDVIEITSNTKENTKPVFYTEGTLKNERSSGWRTIVTSRIGDTVDGRVIFENTSTTIANDVKIRIELPSSLRYIPGSSEIERGSDFHGTVIEDGIASDGVIVGSYKPKANVQIKYKLEAVDDGSLNEYDTMAKIHIVIYVSEKKVKSNVATVVIQK